MNAVRTAQVVDTESLLIQWGRMARRDSDRLGYPVASPIHRLVESQKVFAKRQKQAVNAVKCSETRSFRPAEGEIPPDWFMAVERAVAGLPGPIQAAISRAYRYGQPDRIGARELKISRAEFTARRLTGIDLVGMRIRR